jgi:hypothetical protein
VVAGGRGAAARERRATLWLPGPDGTIAPAPAPGAAVPVPAALVAPAPAPAGPRDLGPDAAAGPAPAGEDGAGPRWLADAG